MARIYVSSTYGDLKEHREEVYRTLRKLGHDVVAMEDYVAADQRPLDRCLADVAACDIYVGIFAHRYGYIPDHGNPDGRSITELEYRRAQALDIPRLVFLLDPAAPWPPTSSDAFTGDGEGDGRIRALREELGRDRLASFFATADQLAHEVSVAITNQLKYQLVEDLPAVTVRLAWTIPPPVRSFTGRVEQLAVLRAQLTGEGAATLVPTAALYGIGGVGKTQLALAYAQRYRAEYTLGWWVPSETELGVVTALAQLGVELGLRAELPPAELAARARDGLGERSGWLLIFDNAPDPAAVAEFLPGAGGGHVLVTSRDSAWQGIADPVPVDLLPQEDAVGLLLRRSGDLDRPAATELAEALGRLPLALEQAAAYAARQRLPLARYLKLFARRRDELLAVGKPLAYHGTVDATFTLALDQLRRVRPAAGQLLELCALLAPDELPLSLLLSQPTLLPEPLATEIADPLQQGEVVGVLYRTGLLTRDVAETARMHRLVQDVTLAHLPEADRQQRTMQATELLRRLYPDQAWEPQWWPRCAQPLAHAQTVLDHARAQQLATEAIAALLSSTGDYVRNRGLGVQRARELDFIRVRTIVANNPNQLATYRTAVEQGRGFIYHLCEGSDPTLLEEYILVQDVGLVHRLLIAIHGSALGQPQLDAIAAVGATLMWSPFSNLWLHGTTAAIAQAKAGGLRLCLGSDWAPSGTTNVLWELKVADLWNRPQPQPVFTPQELCELVTANPGDALAQAWPHPVGRLVPGAVADLVVVAQRTPDVYANLIGATERDIRLVLVGGAARYGTTTLMRQAGAAHPTPIRVAGRTRQIDYGDPAVTWPSIKAALQAVRANPQGAADSVAATLAVWAGVDLSQPNAPFILAPDMPSGDPAMATADATAVPPAVRIPPIQPLTPTKTWFDAVDANPFHQGLLSALRNYAP